MKGLVAGAEIRRAIEIGTREIIAGLGVEGVVNVGEARSPAIPVGRVPIVFADERRRCRRPVEIGILAVRRRRGTEDFPDEKMAVVVEEVIICQPQGVDAAGLIESRNELLGVIREIGRRVSDGVEREIAE